jgi:hypothetical protein
MPPIEEYLKHADELAQDVVNACRVNMQAGNGPVLTDEFKNVFDKACRYRTANMVSVNCRSAGMLNTAAEAEAEATRRAFADAYKLFWEKNTLRRYRSVPPHL